ncbi:MAG: ATP-binding protein, partial [Saprospiraceae bacterium]|nr:ATP-binding protein [Saprospiraceae bacterium]
EFGENYAVKEYLSDIKFSDFWKDGFDKTEYAQSGKSKNLRLWKVEPGRITPYVTHVQNYFEANFLSDKNVGPLYVTLSEVFNNIQDHSNSKVSGFTTCQYYPKSDKIKIAVCDFGIGIPTKIKNFLGKSDSDMPDNVALEKAFEKKFSTQSTPQNRGFGLDTLLSIVKTLDGSVKIFSNKAMLTTNGTDFDSRILNHDFRGTIFEIVLNTLKFDEKEEEVSEEGYYFS